MEGIDVERLNRPSQSVGHAMTIMRPWGGLPTMFVAFALLHALLMQVGYGLKISIADPAVMWPASGLALLMLWLTPLRLWPVVLLLQFGVEVATAAWWMDSFRFGLVTLYTLGNMAGAVVGAGLARWKIRGLFFLQAREVLWFVVITAMGAAVSATIAMPVHVMALGGGIDAAGRLVMWQIWAAGQWAGIITVAPLIASWMSPLRHQFVELQLRSRLELAVLVLLMLGACLYIGAVPGRAQSLLQLPTTIVLLMMVAVMRLPPRWVVTLFSLTALTLAMLAARTAAPVPTGMAIGGIGQLQIFLVTLGLFAFVLSVTLTERSITARRLEASEYRYRNFVELSTEVMWRVELAQPMPLDLPVEAQVAWLREHASVAEFSRSYELIDPRAAGAGASLPWDATSPWAAAFEAQLAHAAKQGFELDGLRFAVDARGRQHAFVASFNGVVEAGRLQRIWGVARDITELTDLNASLLRERERLKSYARQIVTAEEKARRATAVDLHDGIGQSLAGMAMTLDVARQHATPEVRLLVEEVRGRLFEVQERTRSMISDLSPPGLYELGLKAALQWLAVYLRGQDRLQVDIDVQLQEEAVPVEMRVLVFKLVRELLRNVVKHAGVSAARVWVRGDATTLSVQVCDDGKGFEWQLDMFGRSSGFGLWSIANRVNEAGGEMSVDTAPGRGARFELKFPLRPQVSRGQDRRVQAAVGRGA